MSKTIKQLFCNHVVRTEPNPDGKLQYRCIKCDKRFEEPPLLKVSQWLD